MNFCRPNNIKLNSKLKEIKKEKMQNWDCRVWNCRFRDL